MTAAVLERRIEGERSIRLLHVVTTGDRRGAEIFAFDLIRALRHTLPAQRVAVLRGSMPLALAYEAPTTVLHSGGRRVPGLRLDSTTLRALRRLVAKERPDILHAHGGEALKYAIFATRGRRTRVLYRRIGLAQPSIRQGIRRVAHGKLMRSADGVVAVAEAVRRETVEVFRVPPERVVAVPRGVDPGRVEPTRSRADVRAAFGIPNGAGVLLSLGAFHWEKDPVAHVELAARVIRARPGTVHLIAGDGDLRPEVESAIDRHRLEGRVRLLGNRPDVADLLTASDVMVLASRSEGMPGCLIEAGMAGLPVAAYAVSGTSEVVVDGTSGFLVPAGDLEGLTSRVLQLLSDEGMRRAMGAAARSRCRASFDIGIVAPRYLSIYEELTR